jgi:hypothetical protein
VKEATIDYVITKVKGARSRGPAWIDQRQREVLIERILEAYQQPTVRTTGQIRRGLPLKSKVGRTSMVVSKSAGMYAKERGEKLAFSFPHGLTHKQLGRNLQMAAARRHAIASNPKRKLPK